METLTLILHKTKDTKNKVVYGTADGSVYIDKAALGDAPPNTIQVVIPPVGLGIALGSARPR